ncbi:MAG TPA: anti-sigma factor, partial [Pyrinomonadaceae bacterium]|nr:anti-sigma factor [Pyrinomonadaceae bacterium]
VVEMPRPDARSFVPASPAPNARWQWAGWYVAAAACLVLTIFVAGMRLIAPDSSAPTPNVAPSVAELRAGLLREAPDSVVSAWAPTDDPGAKNVSGDVVWSSERQQGYMRFAGLPQNDPRRETYQLWIFDEQQDARYPVDGGVFDVVRDDGEVVVPINAKLEVKQPTLFALTVEKPGGVVVSKRDRLLLTAKVQP